MLPSIPQGAAEPAAALEHHDHISLVLDGETQAPQALINPFDAPRLQKGHKKALMAPNLRVRSKAAMTTGRMEMKRELQRGLTEIKGKEERPLVYRAKPGPDGAVGWADAPVVAENETKNADGTRETAKDRMVAKLAALDVRMELRESHARARKLKDKFGDGGKKKDNKRRTTVRRRVSLITVAKSTPKSSPRNAVDFRSPEADRAKSPWGGDRTERSADSRRSKSKRMTHLSGPAAAISEAKAMRLAAQQAVAKMNGIDEEINVDAETIGRKLSQRLPDPILDRDVDEVERRFKNTMLVGRIMTKRIPRESRTAPLPTLKSGAGQYTWVNESNEREVQQQQHLAIERRKLRTREKRQDWLKIAKASSRGGPSGSMVPASKREEADDDEDSTGEYLSTDEEEDMETVAVSLRQKHVDPLQQYSAECVRLGIVPEQMSRLRRFFHGHHTGADDFDNYVDFSHFLLGDQRALALSSALELMPPLRRLNLNHNRLTGTGVGAIMDRIDPYQIVELNLSRNPLGVPGVGRLIGFLDMATSIEKLCLEGIVDKPQEAEQMLEPLCTALSQSSLLTELDLSHSCIGHSEAAGRAVGQLLSDSDSLLTVNLSYSKIQGEAAVHVLHGVQGQTQRTGGVQTLDLSWNCIGSAAAETIAQAKAAAGGTQPPTKSVAAVTAALLENSRLTHLDLSHNLLSSADCECLGEALLKNHTLMGLHMDGNQSSLDAHGFVLPRDGAPAKGADAGDATGHVFTRIIAGESCAPNIGGGKGDGWKAGGHCWICDRWSEAEFVWHPGQSDVGSVCAEHIPDSPSGLRVGKVHSVSLRAEFDKWNEEAMSVRPDGSWIVHRMAPPGKVLYSFVVKYAAVDFDGQESALDDDDKRAGAKPGKKSEVPTQNSQLQIAASAQPVCNLLQHVRILPDDSSTDLAGRLPKVVNARDVEARTAQAGISLAPRVRGDAVKVPAKEKEQWKFSRSMFGAFQHDGKPGVLQHAFAKDYMHATFNGVKGSARMPADGPVDANLQKVLLKDYGMFKALFKRYCSGGPDPFTMTVNGFTEFVHDCKLVDTDGKGDLNLAAMDMIFIGCNMVGPTDKQRNPKRALTRFQFMDSLVRMAIAKFRPKFENAADDTGGGSVTVDKAVEKLLGILRTATFDARPAADSDDSEAWRWKRLYNEQCDTMLRMVKPQLDELYMRFSGNDNDPGAPRRMGPDEFQQLVEKAELLDEFFPMKQVKRVFVRSMQTESDEMRTDAHRAMQPVELYEAIGRIADVKDLTNGARNKVARRGSAVAALVDPKSLAAVVTEAQRQLRDAAGVVPADSEGESVLLAGLGAATGPPGGGPLHLRIQLVLDALVSYLHTIDGTKDKQLKQQRKK
jgi:hypothetical protein